MSAKSRQHGLFSVRTPEAFAALAEWLSALDPQVWKRGQQYNDAGHVLSLRAAADHYVVAEVEGEELYEVTLYFTRERWNSTCSCPVSVNCKHAAAAAFAWVGNHGVDRVARQPAGRTVGHDPKSIATEKRKISFREEWTPVIAGKLGRPLTDVEGQQLGKLAALFAEVSNGTPVHQSTLQRHGFEYTLKVGDSIYHAVSGEWWEHHARPDDPWKLWQYIAYDYERSGRPIPEVFRPMTDTAAVRAASEARLLKQEMETWRHALAPTPMARPLAIADVCTDLAGVRAHLSPEGQLFLETRAPEKPWKAPTMKWLKSLPEIRPVDLESLTPPEAALLLTVITGNRYGYHHHLSPKLPLPAETVKAILASRTARDAVALPNGLPFTIEPEPLVLKATVAASTRDHLDVQRVAPDGRSATGAQLIVGAPEPLYLFDGRVWRGPPALPPRPLPLAAFGDPALAARLRAAGLELPKTFEAKFRRVELRPRLRLSLVEGPDLYALGQFHAQLFAEADEPRCEQYWSGIGGWQWTPGGEPAARRPEDPMFQFDLTRAQAVSARFAEFRLAWSSWQNVWTRGVTQVFPDEFIAWRASLPPDVAVDVSPNLADLLGAPLRATLDFSALPAVGAGRDWFDLTVALRVEDTTLTAEEIALLLKARGKWVRLPKLGWRRLEVSTDAGDAAAALDRLGLRAHEVFEEGKPVTHRLHALQLAAEASSLESRDAQLAAALRARAAATAATLPPALPAGLVATLRPYQEEGFHFLAHLSTQGFGGILADDMGLGKTVQTLAWLLYLAAAARASDAAFRALVICPKSVTHGWLAETARFAPSLTAAAFTPGLVGAASTATAPALLIANYTQLRLNADWFKTITWDAVVLDEGQFIKNPASQGAVTARALPSRHRLVLTGTPVENRVTDLWSLFAFAQPGLLGTQAAFRRQYAQDDPTALARLHRRVRHFLLRRTKAQAAPDLPPRTEDELVVELEPAQRKLYDAELKRARAQLLGVETDRALDAVRFNVLASLLRLRQICCHPALIDRAHAALPSAKLDALLERLEELSEEGHQVLVFSQFVEMLELIRERLVAAGTGHLMLTGKTENRAELVNTFQGDRSKTVFLLSLKAAGFGLNLTAASYAILYDPWWNPAVEAQAIDRTHRIGQQRPVTAYRLLAADTIEQKIRALQKEKSALAAAVVQEESLASVLDLESLRRILL